MSERIPPRLYTWLLGALLAIFAVSSVSGANITKVQATSSTTLQITWESAAASVNGTITGYTVCYQLMPGVNCSTSDTKTVNGSTLSTALERLNEDTMYFVAVFAISSGNLPQGDEANGTTDEDVPGKGPNITSIVATARTLTVTWGTLSHDDANGVIISYTVCYKIGLAAGDICTLNNTVVDGAVTTTLYTLKPFTGYDLSVRAATKVGLGPTGEIFQQRTSVATPGVPKLSPLSSDFTTISLRWTAPSQETGPITKFVVCWSVTGTSDKDVCKDQRYPITFPYQISNLQPGISYTVSVTAYSSAGKGGKTSTTIKTVASGLTIDIFEDSLPLVVNDPTTQIGFGLPSLKLSEAIKIRSYQVVVKRWTAKDDKDMYRIIPQKNLTNYDNSNKGEKAYITLIKNGYVSKGKIIVGDNSKILTSARKRRNIQEYRNAPLNEDTQYAIFVRVFYGEDKTIFSSSGILLAKTGNGVRCTSHLIGTFVLAILLAIVH